MRIDINLTFGEILRAVAALPHNQPISVERLEWEENLDPALAPRTVRQSIHRHRCRLVGLKSNN